MQRRGGLDPFGVRGPLVRGAMNRREGRQPEQELRRLVRRNGRRQGRSDRVFKGDRTDEREVPHDPGNWFTFTNLSGPELDEADLQGTRRMSEQMKALPESVIAQGMARRRETGPAAQTTPEEEFAGYDKATLVKYGVTAWRGSGCERACTPEARAELDAKTMEWAARIVFEMNVRPLGEENGSGGSSPRANS